MEITLTVNGKQVKATVDEQEMKKAMGEKEKLTGYLPEECNGYYFLENCHGEIHEMPIGKNEGGNKVKAQEAGNFYSLRKVAEDNARADALMRNLRMFAATHGGCVAPKRLGGVPHSYAQEIFYDPSTPNKLNYRDCFRKCFGRIVFQNGKEARRAIDTFQTDLIWYFTEYDPMPEGWWDS